jgi:hypothetical protein
MSTKHANTLAALSLFLIESSKREEVDTGDAVELVGEAYESVGALLQQRKELLAALNDMLDMLSDNQQQSVAAERARAAIAKAVQS